MTRIRVVPRATLSAISPVLSVLQSLMKTILACLASKAKARLRKSSFSCSHCSPCDHGDGTVELPAAHIVPDRRVVFTRQEAELRLAAWLFESHGTDLHPQVQSRSILSTFWRATPETPVVLQT